MPVATLIAPFAQYSGKVAGPLSLSSSDGAVVAMPQPNGQTNMRTMFTPVQPNTPAQLLARAQMASVSESYQSLTLEQVDAWKLLALDLTASNRFGADYSPSWNSIFSQVNNFRLQAGLAILLDAPSFTALPLIGTVGASPVASEVAGSDYDIEVALEWLVPAAAIDGTIYRIRLSRISSSPVLQIPEKELRIVTSTQALSFFATPAGGAPFKASFTATSLNYPVGSYVALEVLVLTAGYVPSQRISLRNSEIIAIV